MVSADHGLKFLMTGNERYVSGNSVHPRQDAKRRREVVESVQPCALIFGCSDARVPPEIIFDCGIGDLFVVRTGGHMLGKASWASIEFGVKVFKIPLVVVLGHERCGAVMTAIEAYDNYQYLSGHLHDVVEAVKPAVVAAKKIKEGDRVENTVRANVELTIRELSEAHELRELIARSELKIVGGLYRLESGRVEFFKP